MNTKTEAARIFTEHTGVELMNEHNKVLDDAATFGTGFSKVVDGKLTHIPIEEVYKMSEHTKEMSMLDKAKAAINSTICESDAVGCELSFGMCVSISAEFDRITELEQKLATSERQNRELVEALHIIMAQVQYESCECAVMKTITESLSSVKP